MSINYSSSNSTKTIVQLKVDAFVRDHSQLHFIAQVYCSSSSTAWVIRAILHKSRVIEG